MKLVAGKPILFHVYERLSCVKHAKKIIIATTTNNDDDVIESFCKENNVDCFRGSLANVLERFYEAAKFYHAEVVVRITSDCPLIDPVIIDDMLNVFLKAQTKSQIDFLSNTIHRTLPRGLDVEIFTFDALEKAYINAKLPFEQEHVTPYIYSHPDKFVVQNYSFPHDFSYHRWTVDTADDFKLISEIFNLLYPAKHIFLLNDILELFSLKPELIKINKHIKQKTYGD